MASVLVYRTAKRFPCLPVTENINIQLLPKDRKNVGLFSVSLSVCGLIVDILSTRGMMGLSVSITVQLLAAVTLRELLHCTVWVLPFITPVRRRQKEMQHGGESIQADNTVWNDNIAYTQNNILTLILIFQVTSHTEAFFDLSKAQLT